MSASLKILQRYKSVDNTRKLGDLIDTISETFKFTDEPVVFLNTSDILENKFLHKNLSDPSKLPGQAKKRIRKGDLLFSEIRPANKRYAYVDFKAENYVVSTKLMVLRSNGAIRDDYLRFFLTSAKTLEYLQMIAEDRSGTFPQITFDIIKELEIYLPSEEKQKAIADVLSSLDDKIDLLYRQNKTLEALSEALFRHTFIDNAQDDWEDGVIPDEFSFTMGLSPPGSSYNEEGEGIPMFQGNADFGFRFPSNRVYTTEPKRMAQKYDTLISVRAPVGEQNMAFEKCCIGRGVACFRHKQREEFYTYTYFKLKSLMDEVKQFNDTGTVFGSISKKDFIEFAITIPPLEVVQSFDREIKPMNDKVIQNCEKIQTLEKLRDALLPKLMNGDIRVQYHETSQTEAA